MSTLESINYELKSLSNPKKAKLLQGYFKTGKGEYAEGDIFIGLTVPQTRIISKKYYKTTTFEDIQTLLSTNIHEKRLLALFMLMLKFKHSDEKEKEFIYNFYLKNTKNINNWDLIDLSARDIIGGYLINKNRDILYKLAKSESLWERRISIISTFAFIKDKDFSDSIKIAEILINDKHDLIHKAVGWVLREMGKKDEKVLEDFLQKHYKHMPRTMLRYAIEKFPEVKRKAYLKGKI